MNRRLRLQNLSLLNTDQHRETSCHVAPTTVLLPRRHISGGRFMLRSASRSTTARVPASVALRVAVAHAQSMHGPTGMDPTDAFLGGAASCEGDEPCCMRRTAPTTLRIRRA